MKVSARHIPEDIAQDLVNLIDLSFDLFTKNYLVAVAVERIHAVHGRLNVLDVGGRSGHLNKFLPTHDVSILDIREPEREAERELLKKGRYFIGSILDSGLQDEAFDLAVSMDMLEHVAPEARMHVVEATLRISRLGIIIGAPFDASSTVKAEKMLNQYYESISGEEHPWLKEHILNRPLPNERELEEYLKEKGYHFLKIPTNNIRLWGLMMHAIFTAYRVGAEISNIHRMYNLAFVDGRLADAMPPVYRQIYLILKDGEGIALDDIVNAEGTIAHEEAEMELSDEIFRSLTAHIPPEDPENRNLLFMAERALHYIRRHGFIAFLQKLREKLQG